MSLSQQIIYGTLESVQAALAQVKDLNLVDEYGYTPLIQTAIVNNIKMTKAVLAAGADVDMPDLTGRTALHWAVDNANQELAQVLLEANANPNRYTVASQPVLSKSILRHDSAMKALLTRYKSDTTFANDYINAKLLGHRFELSGYVDIVDSSNRFTELSYEGFVLEFTLDVIQASLTEFKQNYAARHLSSHFFMVDVLLDALKLGIELTSYQNYLLDINEKREAIDFILSQDSLIIPIGQEGHAITVVKQGNLLAICDRAKQGQENVPTVQIFYINRPSRLCAELCVPLIYKRQSLDQVKQILQQQLGLQAVGQLNLPHQLMGNCSWANVEACIPTLVFLSGMQSADNAEAVADYQNFALSLFRQWSEWDKERALQFCMSDFSVATPARKASKVTMLAAIFVQSCRASNEFERERAARIFPYLKKPGYEYVLKSYIHTYIKKKKNHPIGNNIKALLEYCDTLGEVDQWLQDQ